MLAATCCAASNECDSKAAASASPKPLEAHVGVVPQHQPARRVVGHAGQQRLRQRQVARGVGAPGRDDAFHRPQVVVARHVVRKALLLQRLQAAPRLFVVTQAAPEHGFVERDQRALEVGGGQRAGRADRLQRTGRLAGCAPTGHGRHEPALPRGLLRGDQLLPEGGVLQVHRVGRRRTG
jgi:hypothetical protein